MNVAFFLGALNRGGAETLLADIFERGGNLPFRAVCIYRNEGNMSSVFHATSVPMLQLERKGSWLQYGVRFRRLVKKEKIQIVHAQSAFNAAIAILCLALTKVKIVTTLHGTGFSNANILYKWLVFSHSTRMVCVSEWERSYYHNFNTLGAHERFVVIPNGIDFSKFGYLLSRPRKDGPIRMCMVGNFVTEKDQYFICHFLKELSERDVPFEFYFVGREVPAYKKCFNDCVTFCENNGLSDRVHFTGVRNDIPQLLCQMDAFIYASKSETFGLAPVEAIAVGLPTFLNDLDVFVEIAKDGQYANLYKSGDVQDLYSKFQDFSRNRQSYYDRAMVNASAIRNIYSISTHINGLFSLYSQIMS